MNLIVGRSVVRRRNRRGRYVVLGVFVMVFLFTFMTQKFKGDNVAEAANLGAFDPGYIISDYQMGNYNAMSEGDIQSFLWAKGRCYNTDFSGVKTQVDYFSDSTPPTTWHVKDGHTVCLAEENMNGETAAHIIWQAAQDYRINPQVLIVLLQKETGVITDPIPNSWDYQRATGYGCPDTAACSSKYYGFRNQVRNAASLFRYVLDNWSRYYPVGSTYVQYNPSSACGGSVVNIRNNATSALYQYTPYQPNAAALAAGYGYGDGCSAYGNRNFYSYFEDWFGGVVSEGEENRGLKSSYIIPGDYIMKTALDTNKAVDIDGGAGNGANIQINSANNTSAQIWSFSYGDDGYYSIINPETGKALDVKGAGVTNGTNVQLYSRNNTCAQKWQIVKNDDETYSIISACSGLALDVAGARTTNGTNVQICEWGNTNNAQKWILLPVRTVDDGDYVVGTALSGSMALDIDGLSGVVGNNTNIQIYNKNNTSAQIWSFSYGDDGYYSIINPETGKALDVKGAGVTNGTNVQLYSRNNTCAQKWQIVKNDDETYSIISACSGLALDVAGARTTNGTNVQICEWGNTNNAQKWILLPVRRS